MKQKNELKRIAREMDKLALDVSEIEAPGDADYQADRLRKLSRQLKDLTTKIHGSGTGDD